MNNLLGCYRALDLTDEKGLLCGKILGDLGVDVIKVERPGGDPARNIGPFYHDAPDPEKSLFWFAYNTSKRGITLNIQTADGQEIFRRLVNTADFVIESFPPGYLDELGLGYAAISKVNPKVIMTSITPFGQSGPYRDYEASDIVCVAMGGMMYSYGDADRPPVRISVEQSWLQAAAHAAAGSLVALHAREMLGEGQHVDVSVQEACSIVPLPDIPFWQVANFVIPRLGPYRFRFGGIQRESWPCKDGYVAFRLTSGLLSAGMTPLVEWMGAEGKAGILKEVDDWGKVDMSKVTQAEIEAWEKVIVEFFLGHTKEELQEEALKRGIFLLPVCSPEDLLKDKQLIAREYWVDVLHPELGAPIVYPGGPYKFNHTPWRVSRRPPLIGEHNEEIYCGELGFSKEALCIMKQANII